MGWDKDIKEFEGKTVKNIKGSAGDNFLIFEFEDGTKYKMYHMQDCCEQVYIESIVGNLGRIIGEKIKFAELTKNTSDDGLNHKTWSFYKISTVKGDITIRWYGESNGYYSEEANIKKLE